MSTPAKRACDACHRRKVRCSSGFPCRNCEQASLVCTYNAIPQKKGPKGSRAKIITELRSTQLQAEHVMKVHKHREATTLSNDYSAFTKMPGLLTSRMIDRCIDFFFTHMYPTMPILQRDRLVQEIGNANESVEVYCLLTSLCAFMMIQPGMRLRRNSMQNGEETDHANTFSGVALLEETLRVRKSHDFVENPTTVTIITSFFLFACYFGLDKHNTAWFHLREATTLAQIIGMQNEEHYEQGDLVERSRRRRLFWLLFVTERYVSMLRRTHWRALADSIVERTLCRDIDH